MDSLSFVSQKQEKLLYFGGQLDKNFQSFLSYGLNDILGIAVYNNSFVDRR